MTVIEVLIASALLALVVAGTAGAMGTLQRGGAYAVRRQACAAAAHDELVRLCSLRLLPAAAPVSSGEAAADVGGCLLTEVYPHASVSANTPQRRFVVPPAPDTPYFETTVTAFGVVLRRRAWFVCRQPDGWLRVAPEPRGAPWTVDDPAGLPAPNVLVEVHEACGDVTSRAVVVSGAGARVRLCAVGPSNGDAH